MRFSVKREALLEPFQLVTTVVERRQTLPVLANAMLVADGQRLVITGTDQEVELAISVDDVDIHQPGAVTIPARKALELWRSLPDQGTVECEFAGNRLGIRTGRFNSHLATLPAADFPTVEMGNASVSFTVPGSEMDSLISTCAFAMAQQDVRYFFNGMLIEIGDGVIRAVATNGQRLATTYIEAEVSVSGQEQFIIPRKGVNELARLLPGDGPAVQVAFSDNHLRVVVGSATLTTKLIDGTYPDYGRAIPSGGDRVMVGDRDEIRHGLSRTAILSNEMYRNVRLALSRGQLGLYANNPLQEEAEELITVDYAGEPLEIGFNIGYLIDAMSAMGGDKVQMRFTDSSSAALLQDPDDERSRFVVSPMMM